MSVRCTYSSVFQLPFCMPGLQAIHDGAGQLHLTLNYNSGQTKIIVSTESYRESVMFAYNVLCGVFQLCLERLPPIGRFFRSLVPKLLRPQSRPGQASSRHLGFKRRDEPGDEFEVRLRFQGDVMFVVAIVAIVFVLESLIIQRLHSNGYQPKRISLPCAPFS